MKNQFLFLILFSSFTIAAQTNEVYLSPDGDDKNDGSITRPVFSFDKAFKIIKKNKKGKSEIILRGGTYYLNKSIEIINQKNISIQAFKNENVILSGGMDLDITKIKKYKNEIYSYDLKENGIDNYGNIRPFGFGKLSIPTTMEVFQNNEPMHLARYPNDTTLAMGPIVETGSIPRNGDFSGKGGIFEYHDQKIATWKNEMDVWLRGYFQHGYAEDIVQLKTIDSKNNLLETIHPSHYGFGHGKEWQQYFAFNIFSELDAKNEFYIDRKKGILYFFKTENIEKLQVSILEDPIISIEDSEYIEIKNIIFENSRGLGIFAQNHEHCKIKHCTFRNLGSYAIWTGKKYLRSNEQIIENMFFGKNAENKTTRNPLFLNGGKNNLIQNCEIHNTGAGGIYLSGGNRKDLSPGNNVVSNCHIHHYNRIEKSYRPGIEITGVGNKIEHCHIHHSPHMAIFLRGNDHIIEKNDIHDVCMEIDDGGSIRSK